jgi:hypothetical protein
MIDAQGQLWDTFLAYLEEQKAKHDDRAADAASFVEWVTYRVSKWHLEEGRPCAGPDGNKCL